MSINVALFVSTYMNYGTTKKYHYLRIIIKVGHNTKLYIRRPCQGGVPGRLLEF